MNCDNREATIDNTPLVSIVLPIYNVEEYLHQSLESIIKQTFRNLEILCVDDGSTDNSCEIIESFAKTDSRVVLIKQSNQGVGSARNHGLSVATGKYITFWDPDDYFDLTAIEKMVKKAERTKSDVCLCDAQQFEDATGNKLPANYIIKTFTSKEVFSWEDFPEQIFLSSVVPWNKLVRRDLLIRNEIQFPDYQPYNDFHYSILVLRYAERITAIKEKLIYYRKKRANSLSQDTANLIFAHERSRTRTWEELNKRGLLSDCRLMNSYFHKFAMDTRFNIRSFDNYSDYKVFYDNLFNEDHILHKYIENNCYNPEVEELKNNNAEDYLLIELHKQQNSAVNFRQLCIDRYHIINTQKKKINELNADVKELKNKTAELKQSIESQEQTIESQKQKIKSQKQKITAIKNSHSYQYGRLITWVPRKLKKHL